MRKAEIRNSTFHFFEILPFLLSNPTMVLPLLSFHRAEWRSQNLNFSRFRLSAFCLSAFRTGLVRWLMLRHIDEWFFVSHHIFICPTIQKPIIASMWDSSRECWYWHIRFIRIILLSFAYFVCWFILFGGVSMVSFIIVEGVLILGTISCKVSLLITTITLNTCRIFYELILLNWAHRSMDQHTTHKIDHTIYSSIKEWNNSKMACNYECFH